MPFSSRSVPARAQAVVSAIAVVIGLTVAPALISPAGAAADRTAATTVCAKAQAGVKAAKKKQAAAQQAVVTAKKALKKAQKAHQPKRVKKAKAALAAAKKRHATTTRAVKTRQSQARSACAAPVPSPAAENTGKKLSLLGLGNGLDLGALDAVGLAALLDQLLPGVTDHLDAAQLSALLAGFNAGSSLDPDDALALLTGVLDPGAITDLLGGDASPEALTGLIEDIIGQLADLGGGLPVPTDFDPTGLWDTFAGIFGLLSADQLGSLLAMVTSALGLGGDELDVDQLTELIDSLVPGISESFDAEQLESMLAGINGNGLSAATLASLLGGQFSPAQLLQVVNGTAGQALLGNVIAQVMAHLGTAGGGGLELPAELGAGTVAGLISTVTNLVTSVLGGGGVLPVVCGLIPIPVLCP